jgi:hypothetical protein
MDVFVAMRVTIECIYGNVSQNWTFLWHLDAKLELSLWQ